MPLSSMNYATSTMSATTCRRRYLSLKASLKPFTTFEQLKLGGCFTITTQKVVKIAAIKTLPRKWGFLLDSEYSISEYTMQA